MDIAKDLQKLGIERDRLTPKFKSFEGTRHIIQYDSPEYVFTLSKTFKPKITGFGITNRCEDGKFVLFLEYDNIYKDLMYKNLANLIKIFPKSFNNFYIAKTSLEGTLGDGKIKGSYHVVNFSKHYKYEIEEYLKLCDVDPYFIEIPKKTAHKCHVLRISKKYWKVNGQEQKQAPEFIETYPFKQNLKNKRESSHAHYRMFWKHWKIIDPFFAYHNFDESKKVELHKYSTPKVEA